MAGKTATLEPSKSDPKSQPYDDPHGEEMLTHANKTPGEDDLGLRQRGGKLHGACEGRHQNTRRPRRSSEARGRELALLHRVRSAVAHQQVVPVVLSRAVEAVAETYGPTG